MALIKCPECGKENVSDLAEKCPSCGFPLKRYFRQLKKDRKIMTEHQNIKNAKQVENIGCHKEIEKVVQDNADNTNKIQKTNKNIKVITGIGIGITLIIVVLCAVIPALRYSKANDLFSQGNYEQAQIIYENIGDYKDALAKVNECKLEIIKNKIDANVELEESLEYLNKIEYTDEIMTIKNECILKLININYEEKNYTNTLKYINEIGETDQTKDIKTDCLYNMANIKYNAGDYMNVIEHLDEIGDLTSLKDNCEFAKHLLQQSLNKYGMDLFNSGDFSSALTYLTRIDSKDDTINEAIAVAGFMDKIQGVWYFEGLKSAVEYKGWVKTEKTYESNGALRRTIDYKLTDKYQRLYVIENKLYLEDTDPKWGFILKMYFRNDDLILAYPGDKWSDYRDNEYVYKQIESFPEPAKEPRVGMTAQEVLDSTWGTPKKKNKSTYSWGVKEQWCYEGNRYIYLQDGIVTSISE